MNSLKLDVVAGGVVAEVAATLLLRTELVALSSVKFDTMYNHVASS
jgi:hypothetical protein